MQFLKKAKDWFNQVKIWFKKKKKYLLFGGTVVVLVIGTSIGYVIYKKNKVSFSDWLKTAPQKELEEIYEKLRLDYCKTGTKAFGMEQISRELGRRGAEEWFKKHPPNLDPNFRWTDANRWDKD